ncbi:NYN domain-containing protein [Patescibacteria group bacterium]|nr:NYN domain-containing protein [Patescibacteria group bacterium]
MTGNYAFIDGQNLYKGIQESGWELDYLKFRNYLRNKYKVTKAFIFLGYIPVNNKLYKRLQENGYTLIFKPVLEIKKAGKKDYKGNVDAELVLHTLININTYNKAVIVSGDGDFHCLIEYLDEKYKLEKILTPNENYSSLIRK